MHSQPGHYEPMICCPRPHLWCLGLNQSLVLWNCAVDYESWQENSETGCHTFQIEEISVENPKGGLMNEHVIRKLDSTTLKFSKAAFGRIEIVGHGVGDEADAKLTLTASQALQVRHQDGQLALVLQDFKKTAEQLNADAQRDLDAQDCYAFLDHCGELGGRQPAESHLEYLQRMVAAMRQFERILSALRDNAQSKAPPPMVAESAGVADGS